MPGQTSDDRTSPLDVCLRLTVAISRSEHLDEIFEAALGALADGLGVRRSSILLFDTDGVMRFKAWRGISAEYRTAVEGHTPWSPDTADAATIAVPDVATDAELASLQPVFRAEQIRALVFVPLASHGRVIGKFMLYSDEPRRWGPGDLRLAEVIAAQVAFAVERTHSQALAAASERRLRFALDAANMGTWDWDLHAQTVRWSDNLERIHGLPPGTFDGTFASYEREIHRDDRQRVLASMERALTDGTAHEVEYRIVAPDGTVRWVEGKGQIERDADGRPRRMTGVCMDVTRRKEAEVARLKALEDSTRLSGRLAAIVESSGDAIVSKDLRGVIASWNTAAERMFGYPAAEAIGRPITMIIPADRLDEETMVLDRVGAGQVVQMETVRCRRDGSCLDIALTVSPVRDDRGVIVGASKIARDITSRKQSDARLADLQGRLTTLITASVSLLHTPETESVRTATIALARELLTADAYAIWLPNLETREWQIVKSEGLSPAFANRVINSYHGQPPPTTTPFSTPLVVEDVTTAPMVAEQLSALLDEGVRSMLACPLRFDPNRAGTLVFYYRSPHTFTDVEVQTAQALANLAAAAMTTAELYEEQRTHREAAEAAGRRTRFLADVVALLARSLDYEETLTSVARLAVPEIADWCAVDIVSPKGRLERLAVAHVDPAKVEYARALEEQYPADANAPGSVHEVVRTRKPAMLASIPEALIRAVARDDEHLRIMKELMLTSYMCVPLVSHGRTLGAMTFVFAESGRHYTDTDLRFAEDLAGRAALAIENALAYRQAHEANRLKDEFLATLSHELRTPLNAILGYAQMLGMQLLDRDRQLRAVEVLTRNADALRQIIDDVLDVARITAGKLRLNVQPVDVAAVLRDALATVQPAADAKGVTLQLMADPSVPPVSGDPDRLQQVAWNLLSNAVKFTPRGGHVQLRLGRVNSDVEFSVSDSGIGIEPDFLPHMFERFRQADSRFAREHGGLGLGLSIVRELVELHGGRVSASSGGTGTGATFRVQLPLMIVHPEPPGEEPRVHSRAERQPTTPVTRRLDGIRVLAVDDQEDALGLLRTILEAAGARVTTASSAAAALAVLREETIDVVIADVGMPQMDGLEFIRTVRSTLPPAINSVPAAALTAYARSEDRVVALASGFQMHLAKPINPNELIVAVAALSGKTEAR